jgi:hypothetical protein
MKKLLVAALITGPLVLAGCTAAQIEQTAATVESDIQAGAAAACGIIPTIGTVLSIVGAIYPPATSIAEIGAAGIAAIEAEVCSAAPPATSMRFKALPTRASTPAIIGTSVHGVTIQGWRS